MARSHARSLVSPVASVIRSPTRDRAAGQEPHGALVSTAAAVRSAAPSAAAEGTALAKRNATAAVIGAGDFIGAAIAKKFAAEGFTIFAGRRNADKLAPLVADVEAAGGAIVGREFSIVRRPLSPHGARGRKPNA